ncbi:MAG: CAP domain-containing protein [Patescibacteria group bacterium]
MDMPERQDRTRGTQFGVGMLIGFSLVALTFFGITRAPYIVERVPGLAAVVASVLVEITNNDRSSSGLGTLALSPILTQVAEAKARDMAAKGYFAHTSPEGITPWHWFQQEEYKFVYAGENLAVDFSESPDVSRAWMNSPTHRANILGTQFSEIGIATAEGMYQGRPTTFVVQVFGTPAPGRVVIAEPVAPAVAGTTTPEVATTTPQLAGDVRDIVLEPAAQVPAIATTLPTTTPTLITADTVLGQSAGSYLAQTEPPWWFRVLKSIGML